MKKIWARAHTEPQLIPYAKTEIRAIVCFVIEEPDYSNYFTKEDAYLYVQCIWYFRNNESVL